MQKGGKSLATGLRLFFIFAALVTPGRGGPWRLSQVQYIQQHQFKLEESISIGPGRTTSSSRGRKRPEGPEEALEVPSVEVERSSRGRGIRTAGEVHQQRTRKDHQHQQRQRHQDSPGGPSVEDQEGPPAPGEAAALGQPGRSISRGPGGTTSTRRGSGIRTAGQVRQQRTRRDHQHQQRPKELEYHQDVVALTPANLKIACLSTKKSSIH